MSSFRQKSDTVSQIFIPGIENIGLAKEKKMEMSPF